MEPAHMANSGAVPSTSVLKGWKGYRHLRSVSSNGRSGYNALEHVLTALERAGCNPEQGNTGSYSALCPAHGDHNPSLSVSEGDDGRVLMHCHADCEIDMVMAALNLPMSALFAPDAKAGTGKSKNRARRRIQDLGRIVDIYPYEAGGTLLFQVCRYEPDGRKTFRQRRPDGHGGWIWNLQGVDPVLYRLAEVRQAVKEKRRIWVVEGEKDVESLRAVGEVATCNPGGAGKWSKKLARDLHGASEVIVVMDHDPVGLRHAVAVMSSLEGNEVDRLSLVRAKEGKDISDHLEAGLGLDDRVEVDLDQARSEAAHTQDRNRKLAVLSAAELDARIRSAPTPQFLMKRIWAQDAYGVIGAQDKAGKTFIVLDAAVSVSSGTDWLGSYPIERPGPVLVVLGEGGDRKMHRRLVAIARSRGLEFKELDIHLCFRVPHLGDHEDLDEVAELLAHHQPALVIVDPLYLAARRAKGSQLIDMGEHLEEIQLLAQEAAAALMVVHHWNQTGSGTGPERFSGAGLAEWGRVRISMAVQSRTDGGEDEASDVVFSLAISGDETMEREAWFRRRVWTDDADDLASAMHYEIEAIDKPSVARSSEDDEAHLMEELSLEFAKREGQRFSQARACAFVKGRAEKVRKALWRLTDLGYLGDDQIGKTHQYFFEKLFRSEVGGKGDDEDVVGQ
jgi:RecA-family ATPase